MNSNIARERMVAWAVQSSEEPGFYTVISPEKSECRDTYVFRLNLPAGENYFLSSGGLEMNAVLISGAASLSANDTLSGNMSRLDSFYIAGSETVTITALENCIFYIGGAKYEGYGQTFFRPFDIDQPIGDIHQIHGSGVSQREIMMTLSDKDEASRLICGLTWSMEGSWTSWPPHQHEADLEEIYCYFDMPLPKFGFHISYLKSGEVEDIVTHTVHSGTMVEAPVGYHPTVASPATRNIYMWIMGAHSHESRRYDLAKNDPVFCGD